MSLNKLCALLLGVLVLCAMSVVISTHMARKLYHELEQQQRAARQLEVEYGQLTLEQSTWGAHALIEKTATARLQMLTPNQRQVHAISPDGVR